MAAGDAFGEAVEAPDALDDIGLDPFGAVDVVEDDFGGDLHSGLNPSARAKFRNVSCMGYTACPSKE